MGKSSINGSFSIAMLNNKRVFLGVNLRTSQHFFKESRGDWCLFRQFSLA